MPIPAAVLAALIGGGSQLLGGLFSGIGAGQERKMTTEQAEKNRQMQQQLLQMQIDAQERQQAGEQDWQRQMFNVRAEMTRPQTPYYGIEQGLPATDLIMRNALMGNLQERWGGEGGAISRLGITPEIFGAGTQQYQPEPLPEIPDWFKYDQEMATASGAPELKYEQYEPGGTSTPRYGTISRSGDEETMGEEILRRAGGGGNGLQDYLRRRVGENILRRRR